MPGRQTIDSCAENHQTLAAQIHGPLRGRLDVEARRAPRGRNHGRTPRSVAPHSPARRRISVDFCNCIQPHTRSKTLSCVAYASCASTRYNGFLYPRTRSTRPSAAACSDADRSAARRCTAPKRPREILDATSAAIRTILPAQTAISDSRDMLSQRSACLPCSRLSDTASNTLSTSCILTSPSHVERYVYAPQAHTP